MLTRVAPVLRLDAATHAGGRCRHQNISLEIGARAGLEHDGERPEQSSLQAGTV